MLQDFHKYQPVIVRGKAAAIVVPDVDYRLLKLFAIAVLWRAAVCEHDFYTRVNIGPFEQPARQMLLAGDPGKTETFATWWSAFDITWSPGIMDPFRERWSGINAYRFYFGRVLGYMKVDKQKVPTEFQDIALSPGRDLVLIMRNFAKSNDLKAMGSLLRTAVCNPGKPLF